MHSERGRRNGEPLSSVSLDVFVRPPPLEFIFSVCALWSCCFAVCVFLFCHKLFFVLSYIYIYYVYMLFCQNSVSFYYYFIMVFILFWGVFNCFRKKLWSTVFAKTFGPRLRCQRGRVPSHGEEEEEEGEEDGEEEGGKGEGEEEQEQELSSK